MTNQKQWQKIIGLVVFACGIVLGIQRYRSASYSFKTGTLMGPPALGELAVSSDTLRLETISLVSGETPATALLRLGASDFDVRGALESVRSMIDFRRMRPGDSLRARFDSSNRLTYLDISRGLLEQARARRVGNLWAGQRIEVQIDTMTHEVSGVIRSTLWEAVVSSAGEQPSLLTALVDVFAYDIDFYTELHEGDAFHVVVEKRYANGQFLDYGTIAAAEVVISGRSHQAFAHYDKNHVLLGYYDEKGMSLKKQLLRAPLQYANVTSHFGMRMHPVLGYTRAHNGVDYGVPTGTPVWSVGDGRVITAGWHGGFGRCVEVQHAGGWISQYAHLSAIAVRVGQHVTQKQIIGKVGATGLASGPHLHYGLKHNQQYVNALAQKFGRDKSLTGSELQQFSHRIAQLQHHLEKMRVAMERKEKYLKMGSLFPG